MALSAGTAWHYCGEDTKSLDYLFIDLRRHHNYADVRFDNTRNRASAVSLPPERQ